MTEIIQIKPHHFLDIIAAIGGGKERFEPSPYGHAVHIVAEKVIADRNCMLEFVLGCDDICRPCKYNKAGKCTDTTTTPGKVTSKEEWNRTIDSRLFKRLGLEPGMRMAASEFLRLTRQRLGNIYDIWQEAPRERTERREQELMRGIAKYLGEVPEGRREK